MNMHVNPTPTPQWGAFPSAAQADLPDLSRFVARTLRVSIRHLPWAVARQVHAQHQEVDPRDDLLGSTAHLPILELEAFCWRADVTDTHIAAARAAGWFHLARLLILAKSAHCEALELGLEHAVLPSQLGCEVCEWP